MVQQILEGAPESFSQATEDEIKEFVTDQVSDLVKKQVDIYTIGQFKDLTDPIIEEVTEKVVDIAVGEIKKKFA